MAAVAIGRRCQWNFTGRLGASFRTRLAGRKISCTPGFLRPSGENSASEKDNSEKEEPSDTTGESNSNAIGQPHPCIDRAIRVNYAGELAAVRMCAGRLSTLGKSEKLEQMEGLEKEHAELFKKLMAERRVRPSLTLPLWDIGGFALGSASSLFSEDLARACSEAVEDVVNDHYNSQLREFISQGIEDEELLQGIVKCRDEELDTELGGIQQESPYDSVKETVKSGCRLAIWVTERI